jgi:carbonic anhydrase/acetyltransferase-like protein (isoleucine patch superfamily)
VPAYGDEVELEAAAFVHPSAQLYGRVRLGPGSSVWPCVVVRAEMHEVEIGAYSNLQDFVMVHVGSAGGTRVGPYCSIAHRATLHGCTVEANCLVGIAATLMDGVVLGENSVVAGHAIVTQGTVVPPNSVVAGVPGRVVAERDSWVANRLNALLYERNATAYAAGDYRAWSPERGGDRWFAETRARLEEERRTGHAD